METRALPPPSAAAAAAGAAATRAVLRWRCRCRCDDGAGVGTVNRHPGPPHDPAAASSRSAAVTADADDAPDGADDALLLTFSPVSPFAFEPVCRRALLSSLPSSSAVELRRLPPPTPPMTASRRPFRSLPSSHFASFFAFESSLHCRALPSSSAACHRRATAHRTPHTAHHPLHTTHRTPLRKSDQ